MKKTLKNICLILITIIFIIGLSGCGNNEVEEDALFKAAKKASEATKKAEIQEFNYVLKNYEGDIDSENVE